jgi:signal transduction histidine kinase
VTAERQDTGLSVLLAVREPALTDALDDLLDSYGFRLTTVDSAFKAPDFCRTVHFDVLVLDMDFPEVQSGSVPELLAQTVRVNPLLQVVLLATLPPPPELFAPQLRVRGYLLKPFDPSWLVRSIQLAGEFSHLERENRRLTDEKAKAAEDSTALAGRLRDLQKRSYFVEVAGSLTHELKNLLSIIKVSAHYVLKKTAEAGADPKMTKHLQIISQQVDRSQEQILRFSSFARGGEVALAPCNLNGVVREILSLLEYSLSSANIMVRTNLAEDLPTVTASESALRHILLNLILNARDAMTSGGTLTVRTGVRRDGAVEARVEDNGPGVAPENAARIFEAFFTTKSRPHCTGLGLSTARQLAASFGAALELAPHQPPGACFTLAIPAASVAVPRSPQAQAAAPQGGGNGHPAQSLTSETRPVPKPNPLRDPDEHPLPKTPDRR